MTGVALSPSEPYFALAAWVDPGDGPDGAVAGGVDPVADALAAGALAAWVDPTDGPDAALAAWVLVGLVDFVAVADADGDSAIRV